MTLHTLNLLKLCFSCHSLNSRHIYVCRSSFLVQSMETHALIWSFRALGNAFPRIAFTYYLPRFVALQFFSFPWPAYIGHSLLHILHVFTPSFTQYTNIYDPLFLFAFIQSSSFFFPQSSWALFETTTNKRKCTILLFQTVNCNSLPISFLHCM